MGMRGRGLDPAWCDTKAKRCVRNKPPNPGQLEREPIVPAGRLKAAPGWWVCVG